VPVRTRLFATDGDSTPPSRGMRLPLVIAAVASRFIADLLFEVSPARPGCIDRNEFRPSGACTRPARAAGHPSKKHRKTCSSPGTKLEKLRQRHVSQSPLWRFNAVRTSSRCLVCICTFDRRRLNRARPISVGAISLSRLPGSISTCRGPREVRLSHQLGSDALVCGRHRRATHGAPRRHR
jgi:hypothetical protein